ncbi:MAG: histidine phosphatase family protein [Patescibacteria group bacterium]|nr:histidine phosphatase family protein [Patescibacteria group bacterium]
MPTKSKSEATKTKVLNTRISSSGETLRSRIAKEGKIIYFFRHGEEMNDVAGKFGGWSDPALSHKGIKLAKKTALYLKPKNFNIILTSPLERASQSADIIGKIIDVDVKELVYLKERNTYGILGGISKKTAKEDYPELLRSYNAQEFIPGAERYDDFKNRVETLIRKLLETEYQRILCVTHGYLITTLIEEFLGLNRESIEDGCLLGLRSVGRKFEILETKNMTYTEGQKTYDSERYRKFKS